MGADVVARALYGVPGEPPATNPLDVLKTSGAPLEELPMPVRVITTGAAADLLASLPVRQDVSVEAGASRRVAASSFLSAVREPAAERGPPHSHCCPCFLGSFRPCVP